MVMSFSAFDLAMQEYNKENTQNVEPIPETPQQQGSNNPAAIETSPFDIAQKIYQGKQDPSWYDETLRHVTRTGSRMVEQALGFIPAMRDLAQSPMAFNENIEPNMLSKQINKIFDILPTSEDLQQKSEELTGGYTTPQGDWEKKSDEVFKTFANLMTGGQRAIAQGAATRLPAALQPMVKMARNLGMSVGAEAAKDGVKLYGGDEGSQEAAKLGSLLLMGLTLPRLTGEANPRNYLSSIYGERDALIPNGTMVTPTGIQSQLEQFIAREVATGPTPEKNQALPVIRGFLDQIRDRSLPMDDLLEMYTNVNRNRSAVMSKDIGAAGARRARQMWGKVANIFNEGIEGNLGSISPEALALHRSANAGWETMMRSQSVSNFVMDKIKNKSMNTGVASLFGGGIFYNPVAALKTVGAAGFAGTGLKGIEMAYRFVRNPTLRHYYNQVIENAIRENGPGTVRAMQKLDESYAKELKDPKSSVHRPLPTQSDQQGLQLQNR